MLLHHSEARYICSLPESDESVNQHTYSLANLVIPHTHIFNLIIFVEAITFI